LVPSVLEVTMGAILAGDDIGTQANKCEPNLQIGAVRRFALAQIGSRLAANPELVSLFWEQIGAPANPPKPDLTVLYFSVRSLGRKFALLEFVGGETLEELVKRSDPAACEREIPLFCRLLDAFEGVARSESGDPVSRPDLELIDFGVCRANASSPKLHGAILIGPNGAWSEQIFGEYGANRSHACASLMELCARLPGELPRSGAYGPANLGECSVYSLATGIQSAKAAPPAAETPIERSLLARTVGSPYVVAVVTAVMMLSALYGVGGFLAKRALVAEAGKPILPPAPPLAPEAPIEISREVQPATPKTVVTVRPAPKTRPVRQPVTSIVLYRGARPIRQTSLQYPAEAKKEHISGTVEMQLTIAEDGSVQSPRVLSGDPLLGAGLAEEISKWVYQPLRVNGKPVAMTTELGIRFNLNP
jgi:TonB family protein